MGVDATTPKISYSYSGVGNYSFNFRVLDTDDIAVKYIVDGVDTVWVDPTNYSVTIDDVDAGTGYITTLSSATTGRLEIYRSLDIVQSISWPTNTDFDEALVELAFDKIVMILQQQQVVVDEGAIINNWRDDWITSESYLVRDLVRDITTGNLYHCTVAHTSGVWATDLAAGYWELVLDVATLTSGVSAVTATSPLTSSGGSTPDIELPAAYVIPQDGVTSEVLTWNGSSFEWAVPSVVPDDIPAVVLPPSGLEIESNITGRGYKSDTDADHDIIFLPGSCLDSTGTELISYTTEFTKQIDGGDWAAGDDQPGLLNGTAVPVAANKWYHLYDLLKDSDSSVDGCFLTDGDTLATYLPAGYSKYRWRGLCYTDSSANICPFLLSANELIFLLASKSIFATGLGGTSYTSLNLSTLIPTDRVSHITPGNQATATNTISFSIDGTNTVKSVHSYASGMTDSGVYPWGGLSYGSLDEIPIDDTLYYKVDTSTSKFLIQKLKLIR